MSDPVQPKNYVVQWGYYLDDERWFATFDDALAFYREKEAVDSVRLLGQGYDGEYDGEGNAVMCSDGLTVDERERLEAP